MKGTCHCGQPKERNQITCRECWKKLPAHLTRDWRNAPDNAAKRAAMRAILDHQNGTPSFL